MSIIKYVCNVFLLLSLFASVSAQNWHLDLQSDISWQFVTPIGDLVVGTSQALVGIDDQAGKTNWTHTQFAGIQQDAFQPLPGSPFYSITVADQLYILNHGMLRRFGHIESHGINTIG